MNSDQTLKELAKQHGWYWGDADFGHGIRKGWCKGKYAQEGFKATDLELWDHINNKSQEQVIQK